MRIIKLVLALALCLALVLCFASCDLVDNIKENGIAGIFGSDEDSDAKPEEPEEDPEKIEDSEQDEDPENPEDPEQPDDPEQPEEPERPEEPEIPHEHTYSQIWSFDENEHWHAASCEHSELKADLAEHSYTDGACICGALAPHEHSYESAWSYDDTKHWHAAACEHIELRADEAEHSYVDGVCVCGIDEPTEPHTHTFASEWSSDEYKHWYAATCEHSGLKISYEVHAFDDSFTCTVCGYAHSHTYSAVWSANDDLHWHVATCGHDVKGDEAAHTYVNGDCICGLHKHEFSSEWSYNAKKHWHSATCSHSDLVSDEAKHTYNNNVCFCGYEKPDYGPEPADILNEGTPVGTMTQLFKMSAFTDSEGRNCRVLQGGCTDGTYYYAFFNDSLKDSAGNHSPDSASVCYKYEIATKKLVATYQGLMIEHVNDATYLPDTNEIIAVHCSPNKNLLSVFDADTMELKRKFTIDFEIYSMAYDKYERCFWVGLSYGDSFAKLDLDFNLLEQFDGVPFGYTRQGMDVDSEYIYFARYNPNCILAYDKEGNFVERIGLATTSYELENIFHIGDTFYLGYYTSSAGGRLYSLEMTSVSGSGSVSVDMTKDDAVITLNQRTDANGNVCKVAQCSATDGTYIYFFMNNDVNTNYITSVYKYEIASGKIVATLDGFRTGHTNDVTYNSKTRELIVAQNSPAFTLTIIDADTLEVKRDITIESDIFSIAYDEVNDCYYGSNRANRGIIKLDADFKFVAELTEGVSVGYTRQAIDTDGTYIYMLNSAANCVWVYKVDGTFVGVSYLLPSADTAQSICHLGDTFYIGYNISKSGGTIYATKITVAEQ